jgi:hypothetical protein
VDWGGLQCDVIEDAGVSGGYDLAPRARVRMRLVIGFLLTACAMG